MRRHQCQEEEVVRAWHPTILQPFHWLHFSNLSATISSTKCHLSILLYHDIPYQCKSLSLAWPKKTGCHLRHPTTTCKASGNLSLSFPLRRNPLSTNLQHQSSQKSPPEHPRKLQIHNNPPAEQEVEDERFLLLPHNITASFELACLFTCYAPLTGHSRKMQRLSQKHCVALLLPWGMCYTDCCLVVYSVRYVRLLVCSAKLLPLIWQSTFLLHGQDSDLSHKSNNDVLGLVLS